MLLPAPALLTCRVVRRVALRCRGASGGVSAADKELRLAQHQLATAAAVLAALAPAVRSDPNLPSRVRELAGERRYNSSSRRLYRELAFTAVRHWGWLEPLLQDAESCSLCTAWLADDTPEVRRLRASGALDSLPPRASSLEEARLVLQAFTQNQQQLCPASELALPGWLQTSCAPPRAELALSRSPLYIRAAHPEAVAADLLALGASLHATVLPGCWEVRSEGVVDVTAAPSFAAGCFEVQDAGSQALLAAVAPSAGGRWLDACAGAGGKSLQLASLLGASGHVDAEDVRDSALKQLQIRAQRAGLADRIATSRTGQSKGRLYDGVLVDAPCTGSGTWRRAPHLRWQLTPGAVSQAAQTQLSILHANAARVRPGGLLVYATCSLARQENEAVVDAFLGAHSTAHCFQPAELPGAQALGLPAAHGRLALSSQMLNTDAFFVASLRRTR